jgi:hypothetical protein
MSPKKKSKKKTKPTAQKGARAAWFHAADDGTRPALESLNAMPRESRETLYAAIAAVREREPSRFSTSTPLWGVLEGAGTSGIYEARELHAGTLFRLFCVVDPHAQALVVLSGDARPAGKGLPASVVRHVRREAARYLGTPSRKPPRKPTRREDRFEVALARELEDPYFRAGFERKLAKIKATNEVLASLELARAKKQLTTAEVARRSRRRPAAVSRLLAGEDQNPSLDAITDLAYALGLEIELRIKQRPRRSRNLHPH